MLRAGKRKRKRKRSAGSGASALVGGIATNKITTFLVEVEAEAWKRKRHWNPKIRIPGYSSNLLFATTAFIPSTYQQSLPHFHRNLTARLTFSRPFNQVIWMSIGLSLNWHCLSRPYLQSVSLFPIVSSAGLSFWVSWFLNISYIFSIRQSVIFYLVHF